VDRHGGQVPPPLQLRHALRLRDVAVVVEGQDHARHPAPPEVAREVPPELALDVVVPGQHLARDRAHQADLAVAEHRVRLEGRVLRKGVGHLLLEAGDPRRVYRHLFFLGSFVEGAVPSHVGTKKEAQ